MFAAIYNDNSVRPESLSETGTDSGDGSNDAESEEGKPEDDGLSR